MWPFILPATHPKIVYTNLWHEYENNSHFLYVNSKGNYTSKEVQVSWVVLCVSVNHL